MNIYIIIYTVYTLYLQYIIYKISISLEFRCEVGLGPPEHRQALRGSQHRPAESSAENSRPSRDSTRGMVG